MPEHGGRHRPPGVGGLDVGAAVVTGADVEGDDRGGAVDDGVRAVLGQVGQRVDPDDRHRQQDESPRSFTAGSSQGASWSSGALSAVAKPCAGRAKLSS